MPKEGKREPPHPQTLAHAWREALECAEDCAEGKVAVDDRQVEQEAPVDHQKAWIHRRD